MSKPRVRYIKAIVEIPLRDGMATLEVSESLNRPSDRGFTASIHLIENRVHGSGARPAEALFQIAERLRELADGVENATIAPEFDSLMLPREDED